MVTSCCVIGCTSRHSKAATTGFFRFPRNEEKRRRWLAAVRRRNADGTSWTPGSGDRVCGRHFHRGRPHDSPAHPDYAPSVAMGYESDDEETDSTTTGPANPPSQRYERAQCRISRKLSVAAQERAAEEEMLAAQLAAQRSLEKVYHDHDYAAAYCNQVPVCSKQAMAGSASFCSNEDRDAKGQNNERPSAGKMTLSTVDPDEPVLAEVEVNTEWSQTSWEETRRKQIEMEEELMAVKKERDELREQLESRAKGYQSRLFGVELIVDKDSATQFYTGLPVYGLFVALLRYLTPKAERLTEWRGERETAADNSTHSRGRRPWVHIPVAEQLFAVLVRLRLCLNGQDIAQRMGIAVVTFSRLFTTWVLFLAKELPLLFPWPNSKRIRSWMPECFTKKYPTTRIIIDCMEAQVQRPHSLLSQSQTFSQYKGRNTFKLLVGISPAGVVTFLSNLWGGRVSDRQITEQSELVSGRLLERGDSVMADRGFDIQDLLAPMGVKLNIPATLNGQQQLSKKDVERTRRIAEVRIHVERAIGRARRYSILNSQIPANMASIADEIMTICFLLTNFDRPLVGDR